MGINQALGFEIFAKDKASDTFEHLTKKIHDSKKMTEQWKVAAVAAGAGVGAGLIEFGKVSVEAYTESEKAQTKLTDAYRRFPALADVGLEKLKALAEETQRKTKFDHNAAMEAEAQLAQYHLTGSQIEQLLPLVADYAAKTGKDLPEAAGLLGKAMLGNTRALKDIGINFQLSAVKAATLGKTMQVTRGSADQIRIAQEKVALAQQKVDTALSKGGKSSAAYKQTVIGLHTAQANLAHMQEKVTVKTASLTDKMNAAKISGISFKDLMSGLRKQVGGYADKEAQTAADKTIMLQHNYDDLKEVIGAHLVPVLTGLLTTGLSVTNWMMDHSTIMKVLIGVVGGYVAVSKICELVIGLQSGAIKNLIKQSSLWRTGELISQAYTKTSTALTLAYTAATDFYATSVKGKTAKELAAAAASKVMAAGQWLVNAALDANPIGIVIVALAALAAGFVYAYKHSDTFRKVVQAAWKGIETGASFMWNSVLKPTFGFLAKMWLTVASGIVHGAAYAFGWVPGIGPKLKQAARAFDSFKADVNRALGGLENRTVTVSANLGVSSTIMSARISNKRNAMAGYAKGGPVNGGVPGRDSVPAMLMPNEFIVRADGSNLGDALAHYGALHMAKGGVVPNLRLPSVGSINRAVDGSWTDLLTRAGSQLIHSLGSLGAGAGGGAARWAGVVLQVLALLHQPGSLLGAVLRRINLESGGNPNAINLTDSNARAGHPSMGLMQTIAGTFGAYAGPFRGLGITNPLANIFAGLNYALHRYGSIGAIDPLVRPTGYDSGGILRPGYTLAYNGTGRPETIRTFEQEEALGRGSVPVVQVFIGNEQLDGRVRVVVRQENATAARKATQGRR